MAELRKIITEEDPLLHQKSVEVQRFGESLHKLIDDMKATMYYEDGIGLAAPQVGILKQVAVIDDREHGYIELINPRIVERSGMQERSNIAFPCLTAEVK
jgi:peptide deformylase